MYEEDGGTDALDVDLDTPSPNGELACAAGLRETLRKAVVLAGGRHTASLGRGKLAFGTTAQQRRSSTDRDVNLLKQRYRQYSDTDRTHTLLDSG